MNAKNPILFDVNELVRFDQFTPQDIEESTKLIIDSCKKSIKQIAEIDSSQRNFNNTMVAFDDFYHSFMNLFNTVYLMAYTHPDSTVRNASLAQIDILSKFDNEINLNEDLYRATKEYSETSEAKKLTGYKKKFLDDRLRFYNLNGFNLPKEKRDQLRIIFDTISSLGIEFSSNIASVKDYLEVDEKDMDGLPDDYKNSHRMENGKYRIDLSYPSYVPFMELSNSSEARKKLLFLYLNRATDKNLDILQKLLSYRKKAAQLLGFRSAAEYFIADNMAKTPSEVWRFENNLLSKIQPKIKIDYNELLELKREHTGNFSETNIYEWEYRYYNNKLLVSKYNVDQQVIKEYFEVNNVINGILKICNILYDVDFVDLKNAPVWHKDVKVFEMKSNNEVIGRIYLDLYPRENKYSHFACFSLYCGKNTNKGYQIPTAALVCNFPKPTDEMPGLLTHDDLITFMHEFGHMIHFLMSRAELSYQSGISNTHEFTEVPSQFFENWAWNYDALKLFAKHYKSGEVLPKELFDKMLEAKNVGSGIQTNRQIFYGMLDMTYHDRYDPDGLISTTDILRELQNRMNVFKYTEGTNMQASFDHLVGYAAGYYGYLWSKVYADDLFSVFEKEGVLNRNVGLRFKKEILSKGSTEEEMTIIKNFLNREPNEDAFLKSIGL